MVSREQVGREHLLEELERLRFSGDIVDIIPYEDDYDLAIIQPPAKFYELLSMLKETETEVDIYDRDDMLDVMSESDEQEYVLEDLPGEEERELDI